MEAFEPLLGPDPRIGQFGGDRRGFPGGPNPGARGLL